MKRKRIKPEINPFVLTGIFLLIIGILGYPVICSKNIGYENSTLCSLTSSHADLSKSLDTLPIPTTTIEDLDEGENESVKEKEETER